MENPIKEETQNELQIKNETNNQEILLCPKAGTATSSPVDWTTSPTDMNIVNVMLWMKRNTYQETTIATVAKLLSYLQGNCETSEPEEVK